MNKIQHFDIDNMINDKRKINGMILHNGIKMVLISDPDINKSVCCVGVGAGYLQDDFEGTAHFLEHLLFMGSEQYPEQNEYTSYIQICGGSFNAFTADNITLYYFELDTSFFKKGVEMLSWFFRKPLLDMKHINSEREIINSEHEKNILDDMWIMDDLTKYFIKEGSKYKKFGTGNAKSLEGLTKKDIFEFYNKHYTTDNTFVCIIDSKPINLMIKEYIGFFNSIEDNFYDDKKEGPRKTMEKLEYNQDNFIEFKSVSEYNFLSISLKIDCDEKNQDEFQLANLISWLIGLEYDDSLYDYLKKNDLIKDLICSVDYFLDYECIMNVKFILNNDDKSNLDKIFYAFNDYLNKMLELSEDDFKKIYLNYQKIKMLSALYSEKNSSVDDALEVVENLIKSPKLNLAILRKNYVPEYKKDIYSKYQSMLESIDIKILTNIITKDKSDYLKSKWYGTKFKIFNKKINNSEKYKHDYNLLNSIGIKNFNIKTTVLNYDFDKKSLPKLITDDKIIKREVYFQEYNKYDDPIANISVIRYNPCFTDGENKLILYIYKGLCDEIINNYSDVMKDYILSFNLIINKDSIIYNFYGLNYLIESYINSINKMIHPDTIFNTKDISKYFDKVLIDYKESISNSKFNSPYLLCRDYQDTLLVGELLPNQQLEFIKKLDFDTFKQKCFECFKYTSEVYIVVGIGNGFTNKKNKIDSSDIPDIHYLVDSLSLDSKRYLIKNQKNTNIEYSLDYKLKSNEKNNNELNNCLIRNYLIKKLKVSYDEHGFIVKDDIEKIIKERIIIDVIADLLTEPIFDRVRTVDKIGYVVKCSYRIQNIGDSVLFILYYLIQSTFDIKNIENSIREFNKFIKKDLKKNKKQYIEQIKSLLKSKILLFEKPFLNLSEEVNTYLESFIELFGIFNCVELTLEICKKIKPEDIYNVLFELDNSEVGNIVLDKNFKK